MEWGLLVVRVAVAGVLVVAATGKLLDRRGSRVAIEGFGVPPQLTGIVAWVLPPLELGVAALLVVTTTVRWGAGAALVLLAALSAAVIVNLARGRRPQCHCFGAIHSAPIGWPTVARNVVLAALAGWVALAERPGSALSATAWLARLSTAEAIGLGVGALLGVAVALQTWALAALLRQNGRILTRLDGLEAGGASRATAEAGPGPGLAVGTSAPEFSLGGLHGETLTLASLVATGRPTLLVFADPHCAPCDALMPSIASWQKQHAAAMNTVVVSSGARQANLKKTAEHKVSHVLLQERAEVAESYRYLGTPSAVVVGPDGLVASPIAVGADPIRNLVQRTLSTSRPVPVVLSAGPSDPAGAAANGNGNSNGHHGNGHAPARRIPRKGDPAPNFRLPRVNGDFAELGDFRGRDVLVLFWNPSCGFCAQMLPELQAWEKLAPPDAPRLLVVSSGSLEASSALDLRATVLFDRDLSVMSAFGASGTPIGVLVDEQGRVASDLAVGAPAVFLALASKDDAGEVNQSKGEA